MDQEQRIRRAAACKAIFHDPHFEDAFEVLHAKLLLEFEKSKPADRDKRERIHLSLTLLKMLKSTISDTIATGELDRKQIARLNGDKHALPDWFAI